MPFSPLGVKGITWNSISLGWNLPPVEKIENIMEFITYYKITRRSATQEVILFYDFFFLTHLHLILISGTIFAPIANFLHDVEKHEVRAQSFIALMVDLPS